MNSITLPKKWQDYLLTQPEAGMGYQLVKIIYDDYSDSLNQIYYGKATGSLPEGKTVDNILEIVNLSKSEFHSLVETIRVCK